jgi:two-component system sensor histidine kinase AtoS
MLPYGNNELNSFLISVSQFDVGEIEQKGYLFVEVDITHVKKLESQLVNAEKFAAIGKMGAVLAHEVKTPLTSIKMNADILSSSLELNDEDKQSFSIINKEITRLNNLVKEILQYSKQSELNYTNLKLSDVIKAIKKNNANKYQSKNFEIIANLDDVYINGDSEKLYQVFLNLCENSFNSTAEDGHIEFNSSIEGNMLEIIINDNGKGIPEEYRDKIFEAFFTSRPSGTGLGLSICKKIIEMHGGDIVLVDSDTNGTSFKIELPI